MSWSEWYYNVRRDLNNTKLSAIKYSKSCKNLEENASWWSGYSIFMSLVTATISGVSSLDLKPAEQTSGMNEYLCLI